MAKKSDIRRQSVIVHPIDPTECPFREFRDNELSPDYWGMGPAAFRGSHFTSKASKSMADFVWVDEQTQPLPRSARRYLHSWVRAEELALRRWDAEVVIFEIEHQWEHFIFNMGPEGWRSRYHIYSPGLKSGGGPQHRPTLSKNGCYLVRLFYLGAWRCVWVSDQVPVDATDSPLLPFSPLLCHNPAKPGVKQTPAVTSNVVHLWPLLICKAPIGQSKLASTNLTS
ncbi:unnamed protein product, partial [Brenthis ino]